MHNLTFIDLRHNVITVEAEQDCLDLLGISTIVEESDFNKLYQSIINDKSFNVRFASSKLYKQLSKLLKEPETKVADFDIFLHERFLNIRVNDSRQWYIFGYHNGNIIPGCEPKWFKDYAKIEMPLSEIWRIGELVANARSKGMTVSIKQDVLKLAEETLQLRSKLDNIAMLSDVEYPDVLQTIKLRPFQKVGATFVEATGGRAIICDEMGLGKSAQALAYVAKNNLTSVIICPASLKLNWLRYLEQYLGETAYVCSGENPTGTDFTYLLGKKYRFVIINYDILGTEMIGEDSNKQPIKVYPWAMLIRASAYDCIILDEFHKIKNIDAKRTKAALQLAAKNIIGLSGTPILNRPGESWPILNLLDSKQFPSYERFLSQYTYGGKSVKNLKELQTVLKPLMIRRTKKDVVKELPPINRVYEYHELTKSAAGRYQKVLDGIYETLSGNAYNVTHVLSQLMRFKQVCAQDKMDTSAELALELNDSMEGFKKVIIFSQFVECVDYIKNVLGKRAVSFTGEDSMTRRMEYCDSFQNNEDIQFLVCTTQVAAEGLNLTAAGAVIFNDLLWTPASHQQAEGRAYGRLNDSHSISSYYVIVANTVEDYIMKLLANKLALIEDVIDGVNSARQDESVVSELISYLKGGR